MSCSRWLRRALVPAVLIAFVCFGCTSTGSQAGARHRWNSRNRWHDGQRWHHW